MNSSFYISPSILSKNNIMFKSGRNNTNSHNYIIAKRNYIEAKTKDLDELCLIGSLAALTTGLLDIDILNNKKGSGKKLSIGLLIGTLVVFVANCVNKIKLSKQYDMEILNDSKNNT